MLSALTLRFAAPTLRHSLIGSTASIPQRISFSQSRSFITTPPASRAYRIPPSDPSWAIALSQKMVPGSLSPEQIWRERSDRLEANPPPGVYAGRSVVVKAGELPRSMQFLTRRLRDNRVAIQWKRQMRHEKKGVKRRRLSSERWRRRFADEIRRKIMLVRSIQRRGH